jgi:hypothetical protein
MGPATRPNQCAMRPLSVLHDGEQVAVRISEPDNLSAIGRDQYAGRIVRKIWKAFPRDAARTQHGHDFTEIRNGKAQHRMRRRLSRRNRRHQKICPAHIVEQGSMRFASMRVFPQKRKSRDVRGFDCLS